MEYKSQNAIFCLSYRLFENICLKKEYLYIFVLLLLMAMFLKTLLEKKLFSIQSFEATVMHFYELQLYDN